MSWGMGRGGIWWLLSVVLTTGFLAVRLKMACYSSPMMSLPPLFPAPHIPSTTAASSLPLSPPPSSSNFLSFLSLILSFSRALEARHLLLAAQMHSASRGEEGRERLGRGGMQRA